MLHSVFKCTGYAPRYHSIFIRFSNALGLFATMLYSGAIYPNE